MEMIRGQKLENRTVDLRENLYIEDCRFINCKIILGQDFTYDLRNIVFENCVVVPPTINLTWLSKKHPVIFNNTKVDIKGNLNEFFSDREKGIIIEDIGAAQLIFIKKFFDGCTINGKDVKDIIYENKPTFIADEYWNSKYEELNKKNM